MFHSTEEDQILCRNFRKFFSLKYFESCVFSSLFFPSTISHFSYCFFLLFFPLFGKYAKTFSPSRRVLEQLSCLVVTDNFHSVVSQLNYSECFSTRGSRIPRFSSTRVYTIFVRFCCVGLLLI